MLDGEALARQLRASMRAQLARLNSAGRQLQLVTVALGDDPHTASYMKRKHQDCAEVGLLARDLRLPEQTSEADLLSIIATLNADPAVSGFSVQYPLPPAIDAERVILACDPAKDADGKHPVNLGRLIWRLPAPPPCTAAGVLALLRHHDVPLAGRRVLLIGRGFFTGRPLMLMLSAPRVDAVVTVTHRSAPDLAQLARSSDVLISAAGVPALVTRAMVREGAAVVGVGISYIEGTMVSDIADDVAEVAAHVTPRHGSVGALTRAMLLQNVLRCAGVAE
jgi:methylenetetrahydrofolate dehydrogenase (NADP+) / methenyltetrahydrofolate cyclohydrolase